jgi:AraC family transcriptional regulator of adaptative response / DNA-3-methyladenine glycosylase II
MMQSMPSATVTAKPHVTDIDRYLAMQARDARFDGRFFVGVTSTGIYCRPVCRVRTPRPGNCRFFDHAAQAEKAGFRPCLRCRPELAPHSVSWSVQDASRVLGLQAVRWLDEPQAWGTKTPSVSRLAAWLGVSDRHVRRIFETQLGVSPLQYLQTRRLLCAKQLLADTRLPVTQIAWVSGFGSVRRFNAAFLARYGLKPTSMRGTAKDAANTDLGQTVRLGFRPPYDVDAILEFFRRRAVDTIENIANNAGDKSATRTFSIKMGAVTHSGWLTARFDETRCEVTLRVSDSLCNVLPLLIHRVRGMLDLDADPAAINAVLHASFAQGDGLRVPGTLDGFELAVRAVLGQQISVVAARTLTQRLVNRFGDTIATPFPGLTRLFPTPAALALASPDALGELGIVRQRQAAIVAIAQSVERGQLHLHSGADVPATMSALTAMPGIGDWTAQYIAMRALRWPDAFVAGDVALHKALGVPRGRLAAREAEAISQAWKPWRSYAVVRAWAAGPRHVPAANRI